MLSRTKEQNKLSAYRSGKSFDNQVSYGLYLCFINISWRFDVFYPIKLKCTMYIGYTKSIF